MLIVAASMDRELAGIRSRMRDGMPRAAGNSRRSFRASAPEVHVLGMGPGAGSALRSLLQRRNNTGAATSGLLMLGVAGAVQPGLKSGDLVLSSRYYREGFDVQPEFLEPDPRLWQFALAAADNSNLPVIYADSLTVGGLVTTAEAKQDIHRRYPAGMVNMEDYWVARAARDAGIPFIAVRVVLDTAQQSLPSYLCRIAGSPRAAVAGVAAMPWRWPALLGLWRRFHLAQGALTDFAMNFLAQASRDVPVPAGATAAAGRSVAL